MKKSAYRPRDIRAIAISRLISEMGDEMALIALLFRVKSSGPAAISAIFALFALSRIIFAPISGSIVDRFPSRRLIATVSVVQTLVAISLAFSNGYLLYVFVFMLAIGGSIIGPAWQALIPVLVPADDLSRTYAFIQTHRSFSIVLGAGLGGLLVEKFGTSVSLFIDAGTFFIVGLFGATLRNERKPELRQFSNSESLQGFKRIFTTRVLIASIVLLAAFNMAAGVNEVLGIFLITDTLHGTASQYGLVFSALGVSMVLTGFTLSRVRVHVRDTYALIISALISALGMFTYGVSPNVLTAMAAFAINGIGLTGLHVFGTPIIIRHTSEAERGRVFAASSSVTTAGTLLSTGIAGSLGQLFPVRLVITGSAITCGIFALLAGASIIRAERQT
ncbi:MAG: MFS transporter [Actinobacteria bacterium]|nr:MFS transporter [Actinomycetota bacterium]